MTCFAESSSDARKELWSTLALRYARGIGARRAKRLVEHFGSALAAVEAGLSSPRAWTALKNVPQRAALDFAAEIWRSEAAAEWEAVRRRNCSFLLWTSERYPDPLRQIADAPLLLYHKGDISLLRGPSVAIVGARNCTRDGAAVSSFFARGLSRAGVTVISGMALGIDSAAHRAGMEEAGKSIAVLGTGIDVCYPLINRELYELLSRQGLLLSEFPPGAGALASHFPVRNRLISGLSQGVLVVEAANRSGSLITARLALEQNRDVFAVPGHTMAGMSAGCRELIRLGAKAVFNADDILDELAPLLALEAQKALEQRRRERIQKKTSLARKPERGDHAVIPKRADPSSATLSHEENRIMSGLSLRQTHIDALAVSLDMEVSRLSGLLAILEVRGLVRRAPGMLYSLP